MSRTSSQASASARSSGSTGSESAALAFDAVSLAMVESAPLHLMYCDRELVIRYINPAALESLRAHENMLPVRAHEVVGSNISIFHERLADGSGGVGRAGRLRRRARVDFGGTAFDFLLTPIAGADGQRTGAVVTWDVRANSGQASARAHDVDATTSTPPLGSDVRERAVTLSAVSDLLATRVTELSGAAEDTAVQATLVARTSERIAVTIEHVDRDVEEIVGYTSEVARSTDAAAAASVEVVRSAEQCQGATDRLDDSVGEIDRCARVMTSIAQRANLLAINATIEAARAGDAGKGFGVVALEVKELAREMARAAEVISDKVGTIRTDTASMADQFDLARQSLDHMGLMHSATAQATDRQRATTERVADALSNLAQEAEDATASVTATVELARSNVNSVSSAEAAAAEATRLTSEVAQLVTAHQGRERS